jgi:MFS family permease
MQNVGAAWLMTTLAPTPLMVALVQTATNLPVFLLGVPAGAFADIIDRRKVLLVTQAWMLAAAGLLGALTLAGSVGPWTLLLLTFALGLGSTMNAPAWAAIVPELVERKELPAAIALNSVGFNLARAVGPALGGLVVAAIGAGGAFVLNAVSFVGVLIVLYFWRRSPEHTPAVAERAGAAILAGLRYVRFAPQLHSVLLRSAAFVISASALWSILPLVARDELHSESTGYGILLGCIGAGSILGAVLLARLRSLLSADLVVSGATVLFGLMNIALAYLTAFGGVALALVCAGVGWMAVNSSLTTAAQTSLPAWVRARALAVYLLGFQGAMAIGSVIWGGVASRVGLRTTLLIAGIALLVGAALTSRRRLAGFSLDTTPSTHWPEPNLVLAADPEHGPVQVMVEYHIDPKNGREFTRAMQHVRRIRRRDGAVQWGLFEDASAPGRFLESFLVPSWAEHLRQHERMTVSDHTIEKQAWAFHIGENPPAAHHWIAARE